MHESRLLVVNTEANSVELRDATSLKQLAHLPIRAMPHEVAVHHRRRIGYVCISYADGFYNHYQQASHFLEVIALDELRHLESLDLSPHWGPHRLSAAVTLCARGFPRGAGRGRGGGGRRRRGGASLCGGRGPARSRRTGR